MEKETMNADEFEKYLNKTEVARCSKCERSIWQSEDLHKICGMIQPDGENCNGIFEENTRK